MVQWNDQYVIIGCYQCLTIIDLEKEKEIKMDKKNNGTIFGLKKMKDDELGECLICSEENNIISIYNIMKKESDESDVDDDEIENDLKYL